jgi:hypothetical protein
MCETDGLLSHKFLSQRLTLLRQKTRVEGSLEPLPSTNTPPHVNGQISPEEIAAPEALNTGSTTPESSLLPATEDTQGRREDNAHERRGYYSTPTLTPKSVPKVCRVHFAPILDEMAVTTINFFAALSTFDTSGPLAPSLAKEAKAEVVQILLSEWRFKDLWTQEDNISRETERNSQEHLTHWNYEHTVS